MDALPMPVRRGRAFRASWVAMASFLVAVGAAAAEDHKIPTAPADYLAMKSPLDAGAVDDAFIAKFGRLYERKCKSCHGIDGDGNGEKAKTMIIKPAAFSRPGYLATRPDGQLFWILMNGSEGTEMEPRGPGSRDNLSEEELWSLIAFLRKRFTQ